MQEAVKRIGIGSDHAGYLYKQKISEHLRVRGIEVSDFGTDSQEPVDYPQFIRPVAEAVAQGRVQAGVVLGGSGNGEAITANKVRRIRCALCWNVQSARLAKEHNNANMISIGQRLVSLDDALAIVDTWLNARFQGGRHARRIAQIEQD